MTYTGLFAAPVRGAIAALALATLVPTSVLAQNNALRLGPANTTTYVTFGNPGTCNGGTNNGGACTVASACPGGTCGLGLAQFTIETWFNRQGTGVPVSTGSLGITRTCVSGSNYGATCTTDS